MPNVTVIGVAGAGTMGAGIAQAALQAGYYVRLYDINEALVGKGVARIRMGLEKAAKRGGGDLSAPDGLLERVQAGETLGVLSGSELVVEAVPEDLQLKRALFAELGELLPDAVLASNTSSLSITAIASAAERPERVVGMHFFNPVHAMQLVEVVLGYQTAPETAELVGDVAGQLGKTPVLVADTPGFIVNRVNRAFYLEALRILEEPGADVPSVDAAVRQVGGFPMGPFELMDLIGIDVNYAVSSAVYEAYYQEPRFRPALLQRRMVESGRLGRKTGRGFYMYGEE